MFQFYGLCNRLLLSRLVLELAILLGLQQLNRIPPTEPPCILGANGLVRVQSLLFANLHGLSGSVCGELNLAAFLERDEEMDGGFNGGRCDKKAVVLKEA